MTLLVALNVPTGGTPDPGLQLITREGVERPQLRGTLAAEAPLSEDVPGDHVVARATPAAAGAGRLAGATGPYGLSGGTGGLTSSGIPARAHQAYVNAANATAKADPSCKIGWNVLAGIGRVESNHGRFGGSGIRADGLVQPAILGIRLDGSRAGTATIGDSDGGRHDGDAVYDRAVGPMQFLPGTWRGYGADGDGDGVANPQDVDDAALGAARYLCAGNSSFATRDGAWSAVYRYNHSDSYVNLVLSLADSYGSGRPVQFTEAPPGAARPGGEQASPPGRPAGVPDPAPSPTQPPAAAVTPTPTPTTPTPSPTGTPPTPTPTPSPTTPPGTPGTTRPPTGPWPTPTTPPTTTPPPTTPTPTPTPTDTCPTPTEGPTPTPTETPQPGDPCPTPTETGTSNPTDESEPTPTPTGTPT